MLIKSFHRMGDVIGRQIQMFNPALELLNINSETFHFRCTFCSSPVDEDESAGPKSDSRLLLAKFNTQMEKLYDLLHAVENVRSVVVGVIVVVAVVPVVSSEGRIVLPSLFVVFSKKK